jgi:CDP-diacylglycerol--glycerol-3-phosphate 3-phosphatidyltransferase
MQKKYFTISNLISASRVPIVIPAVYSILVDYPHSRSWALFFVLLATVTDLLDGFLARKLHQVTDFGKIIDPIADKIGIGAVVIALTITGDFPLWFTVIILFRDALIVIGGLLLAQKKKIVSQSNYPGKITVIVIGISCIFGILRDPALVSAFLFTQWASIVMVIVSLYSYSTRLVVGSKSA